MERRLVELHEAMRYICDIAGVDVSDVEDRARESVERQGHDAALRAIDGETANGATGT